MKLHAHGGDIYTVEEALGRSVLDFSANYNLLGLPAGVGAAVAQSLEHCHNYPDPFCRRLAGAIAAAEGVEPGWVQCGNGSADVLYRLVLAKRPQKALVLAPTFSEYENALSLVDCQVVHHTLAAESGFRLGEEVLEALTPALDIFCICNPNNPTGQLVEPALMARILARCSELGILLLVDECFIHFLDEPERHSLVPQLGSHPGLFILGAFTKYYAMAGLRLGYGLCSDTALLERMAACGQPWSVSTPAQAAGIQALREEAYRTLTKERLPRERHFLVEGLCSLGLVVFPPAANFIFFQAPGRGRLRQALEAQGILIRSCGNYRGLGEDYYRVCVAGHEANRQLLAALAEVLEGGA